MTNYWPRIFKVWRIFLSKNAILILQLKFGRRFIPNDLCVAKGVTISITDGGVIVFGKGCSLDRNATIIIKKGKLTIGESTHIGIGAIIVARESIQLGSGVLIAEYVTIRDQDHVFESHDASNKSGFTISPIVIGNNVWLGAKVTVTKGVKIGDNSVIGANSVVTQDIPPNVLAVGAPARVIKQL